MKRLHFYATPIALGAMLCLGACALFQGSPTPAACAKAEVQFQAVQAALNGAETSVTAIEASLASAQAQGAASATITRIQADLATAQVAATALQTGLAATGAALAVKCPASSTPASS